MQTLIVPKNRKPKFDLSLHIIDLTNIPLVVGAVYVKWHLPSSSAAEHRGRTDKAPIREHKATWEYSKSLSVRLTIDKNLSLHPCEIHFEILQDYHDSGRGGRVVLGNVKLNLAEYAHVPEALVKGDPQEGEDGRITRRYLMHDSKVNATLKIGIAMKQTDGDTNYIAPPLRSAMVIGGIAGIMSAEAGETEDMPSIASKSRELSEAQDIYRRTLAASWACETGELPPDQLIEDIFAGGDGGSKTRLAYAQRRMAVASPPPFHHPRHHRSRPPSRGGGDDESTTSSDADSKRTVTKNGSSTHLSPDMARHGHNHGHRRGANSLDAAASQISAASGVSGRGSIEQQMHLSQPGHHRHGSHHRPGRRKVGENDLTEFNLRDDLRSWQVSVK